MRGNWASWRQILWALIPAPGEVKLNPIAGTDGLTSFSNFDREVVHPIRSIKINGLLKKGFKD